MGHIVGQRSPKRKDSESDSVVGAGAAALLSCSVSFFCGGLDLMRLSIVVPACNEEERLGRMLDAFLPYFSGRCGSDFELIVVVNGSTDRTAEIAGRYAAGDPRVRVIIEPERVGKGGALMLGFAAARGGLVGFADADGATPPEAFDGLVNGIGDAGAAIASRWRRGSVVTPRQPLPRRITSRIFNALTRLFFGLKLTDTQCGAKLMRRDALRAVLPRLGITRWAFDVDLLFHLKKAGYAIRELPTTWHDVPGSKVAVVRTSLEMFAAVIRLRLVYSPFRWVVGLYDRHVLPAIRPPGFDEHRLFWQTLVPLAGLQAASVFNLVFQLAMARMLPDNEYGVMAAVLGLIGIGGALTGALTRAVAHFAAEAAAAGRPGEAGALLRRAGRGAILGGLLLCAAAWACGPRLSGVFRLASSSPLLIGALILGATGCLAAVHGALGGLQAFVWSSAVRTTLSAARLLLAAVLVLAGMGAVGALSAQVGACVLAIALSAVALRQLVGPAAPRQSESRGFGRHFALALAAGAGYAFLTNADAPLVKHFFSPDDAGLFAKAAMLARLVVFLPIPFTGALFRKVESNGAASSASLATVRRTLTLVSAMTLALAAICTIFPGALLRAVTGSAGAASVFALRGMVWALAPAGPLYVLLAFETAGRRRRMGHVLLACTLGYAVGVTLWHGSISQVIAALAAANWTGLAVSGLCAWQSARRLRAAPAGRAEG
jgi:glycosyltransferase involved in cell wall biosynthesis/O-antigen/teichoic acid export membrane protein